MISNTFYNPDVSEEPDPETLFSILDDKYARDILTKTSEKPMTAGDLSEACDASPPTVYRRLDRLTENGLVAERKEFRDKGRHYSVYVARLEQALIELDEGEWRVSVTAPVPDDPAYRFTQMWEGMR